jgi:hypothetical protein
VNAKSALPLAASVLLLGAAAWALLAARRESAEAERLAAGVEGVRREVESLRKEKDARDRLEASQRREAAVLAELRAREAELHEARALLARHAAEEAERRSAGEARAAAEAAAAGGAARAATPAREAAAPEGAPAAAEAPADAVRPRPVDGPAAAKGDPKEPPPLGSSAVTDPGQVAKVLDGLNGILALAEGSGEWKLRSAEAVEGDRLVRMVLEVRAGEGGLSRTFRAAEARFVLVPSSGTLEVRLRDGSVTYSGDRTAPFPDGRYTAVLAVDAARVRNAGHPLVAER